MGKFMDYIKKVWAENQAYYAKDNYSQESSSAQEDSFEKYIREQREKIQHENEFLGIKNKRYKNFNKSAFDPDFGYKDWNDVPILTRDELDGFLRREMDEYLMLLEKLEVQYSIIWGIKEFSGQKADYFIECCYDASKYALAYKTYHQVVTISRRNDPVIPAAIPLSIPQFFPFVKLAIVFEKRGEYAKAIEICKRAIDMGLIEDGTKGKIPGRMSRLISKQRKATNQ